MEDIISKKVTRELSMRVWFRLPRGMSKQLMALQLWGGIYHCKSFIFSLGVKGEGVGQTAFYLATN
jgi:hypothetical protein